MNAFGKLAIVFIIVGAMLVTGPTFGFSTIAAERGLTVDTAADQSNANLGIENESDIGTLRGDDPPVRVATLSNNLDEDVDVIEFAIYNDGGALAVSDPIPGTTIAAGGSENVTLECADSTSVGVRDVEVEIVEVDGATTAIRKASFTVTVDIQCNKGGGSSIVNFTADDVGTENTSQTFSFSPDGLKNKDEAYIDLSDPQTNGGVDYTAGTVALVSGSGTVQYDAGTDRIVYTASGNEKGTVEIRMDGIDITGDVGDRYTVTYSEQRKNSDNRDDSDIFYITG
jgi:hypothetical protein